MTKDFYYSGMNLLKILSISFCCSLWCLPSQGHVLEDWRRCSADEFRQKALEVKGLSASDRQHVAEQIQAIELLGRRLGVDERDIAYFVCNMGVCPESYRQIVAPYSLPPHLFGGVDRVTTAAQIFILEKVVSWLRPWDQIEYLPYITYPSDQGEHWDHLPRITLPNGFLIRILNLRYSSRNELLDISRLQEGDRYTILSFIPPNRLVITLHRTAMLCDNYPLMRFIWEIDTNLRIKNVCGDGNCGLWAVLVALKHLQLQNPGQHIWPFPSVCAEFNGVHPQRNDYMCMHTTRQWMGVLKLRELLNTYYQQVNRRIEDPIRGIDNLSAQQPQLPVNYGITNGVPNGKTGNDFKNEEYRNIRSRAAQLPNLILQIGRFANVDRGANFNVWLDTVDVTYLAQVLGVPIIVLGQLETGGGIGADTFLPDGTSIGATRDPADIRGFIDANPNTLIIYKMINQGHFQAIIRAE
jgi:hypothetical protein